MNYLIIYIILFILTFCSIIWLFRNRDSGYKICKNFNWLFSAVETPNEAFWISFFIALFSPLIIVFIPILCLMLLITLFVLYILYLMSKLNSYIFDIPFDKTFEEFIDTIGY